MDAVTIGQLAGGLVLLVAGGSLLVTSASRLAAALGVPPVVVGLTVVAFGTSAPELAVSLKAAYAGQSALTVGNVVGSNIFNALFILGLSATITPLVVHQRFVQKEVPALLVASGATWLFAANGWLGVLEGAALVLGLVVYTVFAIREGRREEPVVAEEYAREFTRRPRPWPWSAAIALVALGLLVFGSTLFVDGATNTARALGVSELVVGLLIVAPGTSLPELATSVVAAVRGERDIAVGNVIGSNLFNLVGVLGFTVLLDGGTRVPPPVLHFDLPVMVAATLACAPVFFTGHRVARWEGIVLLAYYAAYSTWLLLAAGGHAARDLLGALLGFLLPLSLVMLLVPLFARRRR